MTTDYKARHGCCGYSIITLFSDGKFRMWHVKRAEKREKKKKKARVGVRGCSNRYRSYFSPIEHFPLSIPLPPTKIGDSPQTLAPSKMV